MSEAIQPFDKEFIEEVIIGKKYWLDAGLNISRKKFAELMGIITMPYFKVNKIVHVQFSEDSLPIICQLEIEDSYKLLLAREFPKDNPLGNIKNQREIIKPDHSIIKQNCLEGIERISVSFDAKKNLTQSLLEDLICSH
jgi:hypothetical protein